MLRLATARISTQLGNKAPQLRLASAALRPFSEAAAQPEKAEPAFKEVAWKDIVNPLVPEKFIDRMELEDMEFNQLQSQIVGVLPVEVDFAQWRKDLGPDSNAEVDKIEAEYNAKVTAAASTRDAESASLNARLSGAAEIPNLREAQFHAERAAYEYERVDQLIKETEYKKKEIQNWNLEDLLANTPGMEQQLWQWVDEDMMGTAHYLKDLDTLDLVQIRKDFRAGNVGVMDISSRFSFPDTHRGFSESEIAKQSAKGEWTALANNRFPEEREELRKQLQVENAELAEKYNVDVSIAGRFNRPPPMPPLPGQTSTAY